MRPKGADILKMEAQPDRKTMAAREPGATRPTLASPIVSQVIYYVIIPALVLVGLLLPPVAVGNWIIYADYAHMGEDQWAIEATDTARLEVRPDDLGEPFRLKFLAIERNAFQAQTAGRELIPLAEALPSHLVPRSPLYRIRLAGAPPAAVSLTAPLPPDCQNVHNLDLYGWFPALQPEEEGSWRWLPSEIQPPASRLTARLAELPQALLIVESQPIPPLVATTLRQDQQLSPEGGEVLRVINPRGLLVSEQGGLKGTPVGVSAEGALVLPSESNWRPGEGQVADVNRLLANPTAREEHVQAILRWAQDKPYDGITLDYRNVDPSLQNEVTSFVRQVAEGLHTQGKRLTLRVSRPVLTPDGTWNTGAYDWLVLGPPVDSIKIPALLNPQAYRPGGEMEKLLDWTTRRVERAKIQLVFSADSLDQQGSRREFLTYAQALGRLAEVAAVDPPILKPGASLEVQLEAWQEAQGLQQDKEINAYWFTYVDEQEQKPLQERHTVWLENSSSLAYKLRLVQKYNLGGVTVEDLASRENDPQMWRTLQTFAQQATPQGGNQFTVWWTVRGPAGDQIARAPAPITDPSYVWKAPAVSGQYLIAAEIAADGQAIPSENEQTVWVATLTPTPTPAPTPTPTPTPRPPTPTPITTPSLPDGVVMEEVTKLNVRSGPSTDFERVGQLTEGEEIEVTGSTEKKDWLQILYQGKKRWVSAAYVKLNLAPEDIPVIPDEELPKKPEASESSKGSSGGGSKSHAVAAAPASHSRTSFGYGVQAHFLNQDHGQIVNAINGMGFNWAKQQVRWELHEPSRGQYSFGELDRMVNACNVNGINVLFSVAAAPPWAISGGNHYPADYQDFWNFMGALAEHFKGRVKAYEVWNEQNLQREWGAPLSASDYVRLLSGAYKTIKAHDPNAIVVSGAPTPTGMNDGVTAINDRIYLEQMYQAGLARWCDAVGIHPSGFANPPDAHWPEGDKPNRGFDDHPSFFFRNTMEDYRNIMVKYGAGGHKLWPTEFGWPTVDNFGVAPAPGYEFANDLNEALQAQYFVRAYQMGRNWGWVGVMFLWNLNFGPVCGAADEKAAYSIIRPDWSPRPAYAALADMPK
ncbi:MAG: SH3 domain-containing protein [Chloroflexota bacterium]|nr:SH3 domain-containing protein [Chloroflexota bacterium]